ncbi:ABC transporter ATP-binding protein [Sinomonas cyclohexanicum]|uniref:ABC transporter ATP-binding protein n=1 Tax=Sinomonas cyclohexanicum TaxID=322009 RepID=A0ABM7PWB2_SINCY|nr:ABC transporter ATP-binding protein [Corynebacterium cyclohexanicum]BCT76376.1 ABC transporter ATP-binding protein [Corynebacterium cyclohexanicum]
MTAAHLPSAHAIEVRGLVKAFGSFRAVDGLDLVVGRAAVHGFLGPNGAGKTTTIRVLLGLYARSAGEVRVLGLDPGAHPAEVTRRVSYVPGDVALWGNLTGREVLDVLARLRGAYDPAAERDLVERFALDPGKRVRAYSKGNRQKVMLVAAFAARTELLVLDEPTSGLDPLMVRVFADCIREAAAQGRTTLLSSHLLAEVEQLCGDVTIIKDGRLVDSGPLARMRHLAASTVTADLGVREASTLAELRGVGLDVDGTVDGRLELSVPRAQVPRVLAVLAGADAQDITCVPASLEDLFLRHYQTSAR